MYDAPLATRFPTQNSIPFELIVLILIFSRQKKIVNAKGKNLDEKKGYFKF